MAKSPPLLPFEVLRRVLRVATFDGTGVLALSGLFALVSAAAHDFTGTGIGLIVAGAGAMELHGASLLRHGDGGGMRWLVASQLCLLAAILGYVGWQLGHVDVSLLRPLLLRDDVKQLMRQLDWTAADYLHYAYVYVYSAVGVGTFLYQGGMAIYYSRRRGPVEAALRDIRNHSNA